MRTSKLDIRCKVDMLNKWLPKDKQLYVEWSYGRPRLHTMDNSDVGPRLPLGQMAQHISSMLDALILINYRKV